MTCPYLRASDSADVDAPWLLVAAMRWMNTYIYM